VISGQQYLMLYNMRVAVTDANVFIDLIYLGFTEHIFKIDVEIQTTQFVFDELNQKQKSILNEFIISGKIKILKFNIIDIDELANYELPKGLSMQDRSILFCALKEKSIVLSGDIKLRRCCHNLNLEVHGILWIFDRFIEKEIITNSCAVSQMKSLMNYNKWLPIEDCYKRIELWGGLIK
jgi:predicted nucleic acid-binding protein